MTDRTIRKEEIEHEQSSDHGKTTHAVSLPVYMTTTGHDTPNSSPACSVTTTGHDTPNSSEQCSSVLEQAWHTASEMNSNESVTVNTPGSQSSDGRWSQEISFNANQKIQIVLPYPDNVATSQESKLTSSGRENLLSLSNTEFSFSPGQDSPGYSDIGSQMYPQSVRASVSLTPKLQDHGAASSLSTSPVPPSHCRPFQHVSCEALPSDPYMYWRLSEEERCLLTQLSAAYQDTVLAVLNEKSPNEPISDSLITLELYVQECEVIVRHAISFAKRMEDFRQLHMDEQIALLKASTSQVLGIRASALYIVEKNAWLTRMGYITAEQSMKLFPNYPYQEPAISFFRTVKGIVKNDITLYALLHCLVLFDPSDDHVLDRQRINSIRDKYFILLRHYLESVYSYAYSEKYMMALQECIIMYRSLCHEKKPLIKKFFPFIPNKLLVEVLDLE